jgi:hypothetical protein
MFILIVASMNEKIRWLITIEISIEIKAIDAFRVDIHYNVQIPLAVEIANYDDLILTAFREKDKNSHKDEQSIYILAKLTTRTKSNIKLLSHRFNKKKKCDDDDADNLINISLPLIFFHSSSIHSLTVYNSYD